MDLTFENTSASLFSKDSKLKYTWCSESMADILGLDSPSQIVGKSDYDLIWHQDSELYRGRDATIIKGCHQNNLLEPQTRDAYCAHILVTKNPVYNKQGDICGLIGFFTEANDTESISNDFVVLENGKLSLGSYYSNATLSPKEHQTLKLILQGVKPKKIQFTLGIKKSTYDSVVERIKYKMGCHSIGDITYSAVKSGLTLSLF